MYAGGPCRYFVIHKMGLSKIYPYTKFEVSSFTRSKFTEDFLKFKMWPLKLYHAPFLGIIVMHDMSLVMVYSCTEFEVSIASPFPN